MTTTIAAMKGQMGIITYYTMLMRVQELVNLAKIPSEDEWQKVTVEERHQRGLNESRVKKDIVPYLIRDNERFMGAIILATTKWDDDKFESIGNIKGLEVQRPYREQSERLGFYHFDGDEELLVLDGQHRVRALQYVLKGETEEGQKIGRNPTIANDMIAVLLIEDVKKRSRKIFTKVNKHARATTTGQNLITDDNDIVAVLSRKVADELIGGMLVNINGNNLTEKDSYFTTLATIATATEIMLNNKFPPLGKEGRLTLPDEAKQQLFEKHVVKEWKFLLKEFGIWREGLADKTIAGDDRRKELRKDYLCMRPMPQRCVIEAFEVVTNCAEPLTPEEAIAKLNKIPWESNAHLWDRLLVAGGKIQAKNASLTISVLIYLLLGNDMDTKEQCALLEKYKAIFPVYDAKSQSQKEAVTLDKLIKLAKL